MNLLKLSRLGVVVLHKIWAARIGSPEEYDQKFRERVDMYGHSNLSHIFGNEDKLIIPYEPPKLADIMIPKNIIEAMDEAGYIIVDYVAGKCCKKEKYSLVQSGKLSIEQCENIGSTLNKLHQFEAKEAKKQLEDHLNNPVEGSQEYDLKKTNLEMRLRGIEEKWTNLKHVFNNDPSRSNKSTLSSGGWIVMSRDPHDIAQMSYDKSWSSCFTLGTGCNYRKIWQELELGGFVAYLFKKEDIDNPSKAIARIWVRRVVDDRNNEWAIPESTVYGQSPNNEHFLNFVTRWIKKKQGGMPYGRLDFPGAPYSDTYHLATELDETPDDILEGSGGYGALAEDYEFQTFLPPDNFKSFMGFIRKYPLKLADEDIFEELLNVYDNIKNRPDSPERDRDFRTLQETVGKALIKTTYLKDITMDDIYELTGHSFFKEILGDSSLQTIHKIFEQKAAEIVKDHLSKGWHSVLQRFLDRFGSDAVQRILESSEFKLSMKKIADAFVNHLRRSEQTPGGLNYSYLKDKHFAFPEFDQVKVMAFEEASALTPPPQNAFINQIVFCETLIDSMLDSGQKSRMQSQLDQAVTESIDKFIESGYSTIKREPEKIFSELSKFELSRFSEIYGNKNALTTKLNQMFRSELLADWSPGQPAHWSLEQVMLSTRLVWSIAEFLHGNAAYYDAGDIPTLVEQKASVLMEALPKDNIWGYRMLKVTQQRVREFNQTIEQQLQASQ